MLIRKTPSWAIKPSEITPKAVFESRREFMRSAGMLGLGTIAGAITGGMTGASRAQAESGLSFTKSTTHTLETLGEEMLTEQDAATSYNNFYEFGTGKDDPVIQARDFKPLPWTVSIEGEVANPGVYDLEDLIKPHMLEERVYRFRCVEAWSMVVPWVGVPLSEVIKRLEPTSKAKYVAFETLFDPERMPGQNRRVIPWPYVEGLRMDEAMNDLPLLTVGMYGDRLPNQNGAPIRLVVPWKYGFKSIKSIVRIAFTEEEPPCTWNITNAREYGFYSNVNPEVDHPRWSQARERRIGGGLFADRIPTLMFNGYEEQVAAMYADMDLKKLF